jgi:addiction module HigA family antidote
MELLNSIKVLDELKIPPSNRLHSLQGDRKGQYSISINDQYRICFIWRDNNVYNVEMVDYHQGTTVKKKINPELNIHPGIILKREFLEELQISARTLSIETGIAESNMSQILKGKRSITAHISLLLGKFFTNPK